MQEGFFLDDVTWVFCLVQIVISLHNHRHLKFSDTNFEVKNYQHMITAFLVIDNSLMMLLVQKVKLLKHEIKLKF